VDNIIDMSYFKSVLADLANDDCDYRIFYETKSNLKREHLEIMAASGCVQIQPGVESLHDETLRIMRKGTTACANIQLLKYCLEYGVRPSWSILCGFPGSDPEWVAQVARDFVGLTHLPPPLGTFLIRFDRFSPYHNTPEAFGLDLRPVPSYERIYPLTGEDLEDLAYFFRDGAGPNRDVNRYAQESRGFTRKWWYEFFGSSQPQLTIDSDDGREIRIADTRGCATSSVHRLSGHVAAVLRALETPVGHEGLGVRLRDSGLTDITDAQMRDVLDRLLEDRLIWESSTQCVALPTPPPRRPMWRGSVVGEVHLGKYMRDNSRQLVATP
jgi:magnesium-protoporphyrin IX monomethyl ester (oxidative) cyclase